MVEQNHQAWEKLRQATDEEIRTFVSNEKERLGDLLQGYAVSWCRTETEYHLELSSEARQGNMEFNPETPWPFGTGFIMGRTLMIVDGEDMLDQVMKAGREFYFQWRKDIPGLRRDLGRK